MITMKLHRRIRRSVKTGLSLSSPSRNDPLQRLCGLVNGINFIRGLGRMEAFFWVDHLCSSIESILVRAPSSLSVPSSPI
jgi:hypothetical protein